jgi:hypothetical protein
MKITIVIILFNLSNSEPKIIKSLREAFNRFHKYKVFYNFVIYANNSEYLNYTINLPFDFIYQYTKLNHGFAEPLNFVLANSLLLDTDWLLIFDEFTELDKNFFIQYENEIFKCILNPTNVAMVSKSIDNNLLISPSKVFYGGIHRTLDISFIGNYKNEIYSIISGTSIKYSYLNSLNDFDGFLWLDSFDRWFFSFIYTNRKTLFISNIKILHEINIINHNSNNFNIERYSNFIYAEAYYIKKYKKNIDLIIFYFRIIFRILYFKFKQFDLLYKLTLNLFVNSLKLSNIEFVLNEHRYKNFDNN